MRKDGLEGNELGRLRVQSTFGGDRVEGRVVIWT